MPGGKGLGRFPRVWPHQSRSRAIRASACRHYDRCARCFAGCGNGAGGVTPPRERQVPRSLARCRTQRMTSPWGRAVVERPQRAHPIADGRRKPLDPWCDRNAASVAGLTTVRLPAFRFLIVTGSESRRDCFVARMERSAIRGGPSKPHRRSRISLRSIRATAPFVIASEAKQSSRAAKFWIASSLRSSQ